jgi:hypothetical protein
MRRIALLLVAVLAISVIAMTPAQAGGPTSVVLSAPNIPEVVAVGYDDKAYSDLQQLLSTPAATDGEEHAEGRVIRATWLIHDMTVWRLDLIYPDARGGPWIATSEDRTGNRQLSENPVWHRATDSAGLSKLLHSLGLMGDSKGEPVAPAQAAPEAATDQPAATLKADQSTFSGWRWSIPGFLVGALLALAAVRYLPRRRPWELTDEE